MLYFYRQALKNLFISWQMSYAINIMHLWSWLLAWKFNLYSSDSKNIMFAYLNAAAESDETTDGSRPQNAYY